MKITKVLFLIKHKHYIRLELEHSVRAALLTATMLRWDHRSYMDEIKVICTVAWQRGSRIIVFKWMVTNGRNPKHRHSTVLLKCGRTFTSCLLTKSAWFTRNAIHSLQHEQNCASLLQFVPDYKSDVTWLHWPTCFCSHKELTEHVKEA
jgi:hypothetical protein